MEIRLNKLISEAGVCSRREADNFIEMERVTVNGKQPHVGQKVTAEDVVLVDGERLNVEKYIRLQEEEKKEVQQEKELLGTLRKAKPENKGGREGAKMEKFGKFNKYAAARKAQKEGGWKSKTAKLTDEEKLLRDALRPKFGKALSKSAGGRRGGATPPTAPPTPNRPPFGRRARTTRSTRRNVPPTGKTGITEAMSKKVILVTGGQRSGKSGYAQRLALSLSPNPVYLATSRIWDEEFRKRVERHQRDRGPEWTNIEEDT